MWFVWCVRLSDNLSQRFRQLVGAGGALVAATYTFEARDYV